MAIVLVLALFAVPAAEVCAGVGEMPADCPMSRMGHSAEGHAAMEPGESTEHGSKAGNPTLCHRAGPTAADCCATDLAPQQGEAVSFSTPKLEESLAPSDLESTLDPDSVGAEWTADHAPPPPPQERRALLSSYLL